MKKSQLNNKIFRLKFDGEGWVDVYFPLSEKNVLKLLEYIFAELDDYRLSEYCITIGYQKVKYPVDEKDFFLKPMAFLNNNGYKKDEMARIIYEALKIAIKDKELEKKPDYSEYLLFEKYYDCKVSKIELTDRDSMKKFRFYVPEKYPLHEEVSQKKIEDTKKIRQMFIDIVVPQQFSFPEDERIYTHDYLTEFELTISRRES